MNEVNEGRVVWEPNRLPDGSEGPQAEFVGAQEPEVLYGGSAGGGKSDSLVAAVFMEADQPGLRGLITRSTYPELLDLIDRAHHLYGLMGATWKAQDKRFTFPAGGTVQFGSVRTKQEARRYEGRAFTFIGIDELTHLPPDDIDRFGRPYSGAYDILLSRLRSPDPNIRLRMRATTNPGGVGHGWVRSHFDIPADGSRSKVWDDVRKRWRKFVPARVTDNPYYAGTSYETSLRALSTRRRRMLLEGRWDVVEGAMFGEDWDPARHVIRPFEIPETWERWRCMDDGFVAPAAIYWMARSQDGRIYVTDEIYASRLSVEDIVAAVREREGDNILAGDIDPSAFAKTDETITRGEKMNQAGLRWTGVTKWAGSRVARVQEFFRKLGPMPNDPKGRPGILFFSNCRNAIRTIPVLPVSPTNPEDVDTNAEDHCFIAGTRVDTEHGQRPIEGIAIGDRVWTREGFRRVVLTHSRDADLFAMETNDGRRIVGSGNHRFITWRGRIRLDALDQFHVLRSIPNGGVSPARPAQPAGRGRVYNITVEGPHEYYAEGILVANCFDAVTYGLQRTRRGAAQIKVGGM